MPADNDPRSVLRCIEDELCAVRQAIINGDIDALERHTTATGDLLSTLNSSLKKPDSWRTQHHQSLHNLASNILVLVQKSRRNVRALGAVYRFLTDSAQHAELEVR